MTPVRPVILTTVRYYLPGDLSGGPVRSLSNLVAALGDEYDFRIITNDRDWQDAGPYQGVAIDSWNEVGKARVYYLSPDRRTAWGLWKLMSETPHDLLYLNSFFHPWFTQWPLWMQLLRLCPRKPAIVAPKGEFSPGALRLGRWKKRLYKAIARTAGVYRQVWWHASNDLERAEIQAALGARWSKIGAHIAVASDIPSLVDGGELAHTGRDRPPGAPLRIVFLSRIHPKKNLDFALRVLASVRTPVEFSIFGPIDEPRYWQHCRSLIAKLPPHVVVRHEGAVPHRAVADVLGSRDLLFLPTLGENYGHVVIESLMAGTPVLISDRTPWRGLEAAGVGWDLPLDDEQAFVSRVESICGLPAAAGRDLRARVRRYGIQHAASPTAIADHRRLFETAALNSPREH